MEPPSPEAIYLRIPVATRLAIWSLHLQKQSTLEYQLPQTEEELERGEEKMTEEGIDLVVSDMPPPPRCHLTV